MLTMIRVTNMFSMKDSKPHALQRRLVSNSYSKSQLQASPEIHHIAQNLIFDRYLPLLDSFATSGASVEVHELNFATTMDFINAYIFGLSNGSNFIQDLETRKHLLHIYQCRRPYIFYPQEIPSMTNSIQKLRIPIIPKWVDAATNEFEAFCLKMCNAAAQSLKATSLKPANTPVVYRNLSPLLPKASSSSPSTSGPDPSLLIASELLDHLAAGHETSGVTLTYALYRLSQHPALQSALRTELSTLSPPITDPPSTDPPSLPSARQIDSLPLLHAILTETLRLHAAIPGPQPRETPATPTSLAGSPPLPGGVRVSAQAYSLHRNADVFPEPEEWKPERWMEASKEGKEEMARWFWAFGSGGRMCVGSHFAMQEMKLLLAAIYTNYTTSIIDDTGIEMIDAYVSGPKGNQLTLRFERADGA
jgi:cytochrome P450